MQRALALRSLFSSLVCAASGVLASSPLLAQQAPPPSREVPYAVDTGLVVNETRSRGVVASFEVIVPRAVWLRLYFDEVQLAGDPLSGEGATLRVTSFDDGAVQELSRYEVRQWRQSTAYFNGSSVLVEIVASPGTGPSRLVLARATAGLLPVDTLSQCGPTDDRILSSDPRAGRLMPVGCTGWLIDDCARCMLSAGHCSGFDVVEFNVPLSSPGGGLNHPPPEDQYAVDLSSEQGLSGGVGNDWDYFGTFPNAITGLTAGVAQGSVYHLSVPPPFDSSETIRITGYGVDSSPSTHNQVQQTHVGPWFAFFGTTLQYQTDTEGGNSGSPVIHEQSGSAIGIHTHGGCSSSSGNSGTSAGHAGLQNALDDPQGVCTGSMQILSRLPDVLAPGVGFDVDLEIPGGAIPGSEKLYARYDGAAFVTVQMVSMGGDLYRATLPPPVCGATPEYYFEANSIACGLQRLPVDAPNSVFTAVVGDTTQILLDEMETDQGWQGGVSGDTATTGVWTRVDPNGTSAQPADDHTDPPGVMCWVTGQGTVGEFDGANDVDNGKTTLLSPMLDALGSDNVLVSYWRWYSNDKGGAPDEDVFTIDISDDNGSTWTNVEVVGPDGPEAGGGWFEHSFLVSDFVTPTNQIRLRFIASDLGSASLVEAAVDDVHVFIFECDQPLPDCNQNGILDSDDIASGRSNDANGDGVPDECGGGPGTPYCFCDTGAPCGNVDASAGCSNSTGAGALLAAGGSASVGADDLVLTASQLPANQNGVFYMGGGTSQTVFGDGQRCVVAGGAGIFRYTPVQNSGPGGVLVLGPGIVARSQTFPAEGRIQVGQTWNFQGWYRDPMGPCGSGSNTSNGMAVLFLP